MPAIDYVPASQTGMHTAEHNAQPSADAASRVTEILLHNSRVSLHPVLLPMISQLSRDNRWLTLINPPSDLSRDLLHQSGALTGQMLSLRTRDGGPTPLTLCQKALAAGTSHTVIAWCESGRTLPLQQLEGAAIQGGAQAILVRH